MRSCRVNQRTRGVESIWKFSGAGALRVQGLVMENTVRQVLERGIKGLLSFQGSSDSQKPQETGTGWTCWQSDDVCETPLSPLLAL